MTIMSSWSASSSARVSGARSMVSRVMAAIASERGRRLRVVVQSVAELLQDERAKWVRSIWARAKSTLSSSVFDLLCSGCVRVLSRGRPSRQHAGWH